MSVVRIRALILLMVVVFVGSAGLWITRDHVVASADRDPATWPRSTGTLPPVSVSHPAEWPVSMVNTECSRGIGTAELVVANVRHDFHQALPWNPCTTALDMHLPEGSIVIQLSTTPHTIALPTPVTPPPDTPLPLALEDLQPGSMENLFGATSMLWTPVLHQGVDYLIYVSYVGTPAPADLQTVSNILGSIRVG